MKFLFLSHSPQVGVFRVGSHHLSRELAALGHDVAHVSTPITAGHLPRLRQPAVRERARMVRRHDADGVRHLVAAAPLPLRFGGLNHRTAAAHIRTALGSAWLASTDVVLVDQALFDPLIASLAPQATLIYRPTDSHDPATPIGRAEAALVARAGGVIATSEPVLDSLGPRARQLPWMLLENGVELGRFAEIDAASADRTGDAVYVGALDHRFDWPAVAHIARALPAVTVDLIGPAPDQPPVELPENVRLLGPVAYADLPATLARYRVGLLPLADVPVNAGRSPMKYFEYLAAGLRIVARATPALDRLAAPGAHTYAHPAAAAELIEAAMGEGANLEGAAYAAEFDWRARAARLADFAEGLAGRAT